MRYFQHAILSILVVLSLFRLNVDAQKPLMDYIFAADPSARIWPTDPNTLWLYTSHDILGTNHHATMFGYHVFSTTDMLYWIDHGLIDLKAGDNIIRFTCKKNVNLKVDWFKLEI